MMRRLIFALLLVPCVAQAFPVQDAPVQDSVQVAADEALERRLQAVYAQIPAFSNVQAEVNFSVVHLQGEVIEVEDREEAEALANRMDGVVYVVNDLETAVQIEARVTPAILRIQEFMNNAVAFLPLLGVALIVFCLVMILAYYVGRLRKPFDRFGVSPLVRSLVSRLLRLVVITAGLLLVLDILGITALVGALLGAAGLFGIAIGFAFQDIVENYLAGILMSIRRPFNLGDTIKIGSEQGKVVRLTARELIMMTMDGNHVRVPNATVFKSTLYNYTRNPRRRFDFEVGIGVEEDLLDVQKIGLNTLNALRGVMESPEPAMRIKNLGDSSVVVTFYAWVDQTEADFGKVRSEAIRLVKVALDEAGVSMPEPAYLVRMSMDQVKEEALEPVKEEAPPVLEQARQAEVAVDYDIDKQIQEDLAKEDEQNLLAE